MGSIDRRLGVWAACRPNRSSRRRHDVLRIELEISKSTSRCCATMLRRRVADAPVTSSALQRIAGSAIRVSEPRAQAQTAIRIAPAVKLVNKMKHGSRSCTTICSVVPLAVGQSQIAIGGRSCDIRRHDPVCLTIALEPMRPLRDNSGRR